MKQLSKDNWNQHDETSSFLISFNRTTGVERCLTGSGWAEIILGPKLNQSVPDDVVELFEVARGILVYGWLFYPLYTVGSEQLFHVLESAATHRCAQLNAPGKVRTFAMRIDWLFENGHLTEQRLKQWQASRSLRNGAAHKKRQSIFDPTMAVKNVGIVVELINVLFLTAGAEQKAKAPKKQKILE